MYLAKKVKQLKNNAMYSPKTIYAKLALEVISNYLKGGDVEKIEKREVPKELSKKQACFVTIHNLDGSLRGCIGTITSYNENLYHEIIHNAISAAVHDPRFEPMTEDELDNIKVSVDVLSVPEKIQSLDELDPKKFGIIVSDYEYRRGLLLPNLEGVDTIKQQLSIASQKAGIYESNIKKLDIYKFTSTRYY